METIHTFVAGCAAVLILAILDRLLTWLQRDPEPTLFCGFKVVVLLSIIYGYGTILKLVVLGLAK